MGNFWNNLFKSKKEIKREEAQIKREEELSKRIEFYKQFVLKGDLYFDVGANVGNRIEPLLNIGAKVVAIEPQEECYKQLENTFGDKITLVTEGLGECEDIKDFYIASASTISSFSKEWIDSMKEDRFKEFNWNKTVQVKITTLDNLINKYGLPKFIKIDVEGYELEVLKGLSTPVKYLSLEYAVPEQTVRAQECVRRLEKIDKNYLFNYSVGESMALNMTEWISADEMCELISSQKFIDTEFGDIYAYCKE